MKFCGTDRVSFRRTIVPHKAVAEIAKFKNLKEREAVRDGWMTERSTEKAKNS